ncbi:MAG: Gfo/Idh/MocA family oxidoreductase, partial [Candidatus Poribacteria bacterium]
DLSIKEFRAHRRALQSESLKGDYVKSFGEKVIANALFEHGVPYKYERPFNWDGINYRPDFTIETGERTGVAIEYFGLSCNPDYDEQADAKRDFWNGFEGWTLVEFKPSDLRGPNGEEGFVELLRSRLDELGVPSGRLSEEEIWSLVKDRAIDRFTTAMTGFVGRCRKLNLSPDELREKIGRHSSSSKAEQLFLEAAVLVHSSYLALLFEAEKEDFDGLMWRATELVQGGQTCFSRDGGNELGDLASIRFGRRDAGPDDFILPELDCLPAPRGQSPESYGAELGVPPVTPATRRLGDASCFVCVSLAIPPTLPRRRGSMAPPTYHGGAGWIRTMVMFIVANAIAGGGALINQAIHAMDVLGWIVGDVKSVTGYAGARVHDIEVEDTAVAALRFASGAFGIVEASTTTYPQTEERIEIAGSRGSVTIEGGRIVQHELLNGPADAPALEADDPRFQGKSYYGASHPLVIEDFVAAVRDGRPPAVDGREGRKVLEVIFGIYESSRTGREVVLGGGVGGGK